MQQQEQTIILLLMIMMKAMFSNTNKIAISFVSCIKKDMKKLLLIALLVTSLSSFAQYSKSYNPPKGWGSAELYLPASILVSTFTINQSVPMSLQTRNKIALTGMLTSVATHFIFRKIRSKNKNRITNN